MTQPKQYLVSVINLKYEFIIHYTSVCG